MSGKMVPSEGAGIGVPGASRTRPNREPVRQLAGFFKRGITAADIAEPLVSWDGGIAAAEAGEQMASMDFDVAGIRIGGAVSGWCHCDDLGDGRLIEYLRSFFDAAVVASSTPLFEVIERLGTSTRVFVTAFGGVGGIVTRADLQKAPVRMWLFGLVTLVEETFTRILKDRFPGEAWFPMLSEGRLEIARRLHEERQRRNEHLDLADCLQFADKGTILFKDEGIRKELGFESRTRAKEVLRDLQKLRNNLAHSQNIVEGNLETIVGMAFSMDRILEIVGR